MPQRRLLYLDATHLGAYLWTAGALREEGSFLPGEQGVAAFSEHLHQHRSSNFYLLADIVEEGFQLESLPYTQGADRRALLARKLGQYFYGSPLATTISFGREKTGRRDEKILFTALTRPPLLDPWLAAMRHAEVALAGVYSLPLLCSALLKKVKPAHPKCLLVTVTSAGIRQSFFENGQIRFSRLTPLPATPALTATNAVEAASACVIESIKILQYLLGQRLVARSASLPVVLLAHPTQSATFIDVCHNTDDLQFQIVDLHELSRACGLNSPPVDSRSELLFLHLLAQRPPREQFAAAPERRFYRLRQIRSALLGVGALALVACLLFSGKQLYEAMDLHSRTEDTRIQATADAEKYAAIQRTFPPMPTSTENLRAAMSRYDEMVKRTTSLEPLYIAISHGLQESPRVDLDRIDWLLSSNPDEGTQLQEGRTPTAPTDQKGGAMSAIAIVNATLPTAMANDQRGQLEAVNSFAASLRRDQSLKVTVLRMPFDIESGKSLKSGGELGGASTATPTQPKFVLHLSRKL